MAAREYRETLSSFLFIMSSLNNNFTSLKTNLLLTVNKKLLVDTSQNLFKIFVRKKTGGLNRLLLFEGRSSEEACYTYLVFGIPRFYEPKLSPVWVSK